MKDKLTIVIPCKNEENYIGDLLNSLKNQKDIEGVRIFIADAGSTDNTINIIKSFTDILSIKLIKGGLPSIDIKLIIL
jgi:glycosyltransferase involved in cell wall biosynthesis